jgi:glycosyltransferase involved in cell wall biosynthesis
MAAKGGMKRLLLVSYGFPPMRTAESIMVLKKVRVLARHFAITVVTLDNHRGLFPQDAALAHHVPPGVEVIRIPGPDPTRLSHRAGHLIVWNLFPHSQLVRYFDQGWVWLATPVIADLLRQRFDVLVTNAQDMCAHMAGYRARPAASIPWVQHYSDPMLGATFRRVHLLSSYMDSRAIRQFLSHATLITMPSDEMADEAFVSLPEAECRRLRERTTVVPHTYDGELMEAGRKRYPDAGRWFEDRRVLHVCYLGSLYGARGADLLLRAASRLRAEDGRPIVIHVFGHADEQSAAQLNGSGVIFHGSVEYLESLALMRHADALLLLDVARPRSPFFPSKLADYLGTDRPIVAVASPDSAVGRIARDTGLTPAAWDDRPIVVPGTPRTDTRAARADYQSSDRSLWPLIEKLNRLAGAAPEAGFIRPSVAQEA